MTNPELANDRRANAIAAVERWLESNAHGVRPLTGAERRTYVSLQLSAAWRFVIQYPEGEHELDLLLCDRFPWRLPRLALADRRAHLVRPHVDADGILCALPHHAEMDPDKPVEAVHAVLAAAACLLEESTQGARDDDFRHEFHSYWPNDENAVEIISLLEAVGPSRNVKVWRGEQFYLAGEDTDGVVRWLNHYAAGSKPTSWRVEDALLLWLERPLLPSEYPRTALELLTVARSVGAETHLRRLADRSPERLVAVLGAPSANGAAFGGVTVVRPSPIAQGPGRRGPDPLTRGFRPDRVPPGLRQGQMLGGLRVLRSRVARADPAWVHGRGVDTRQPTLASATVTLIGCGSVGAPVATLLAQAGVGRLVLIDPDLLTWANIGRHSLGAHSVRRPKAKELAEQLQRNYPHLRDIAARHAPWEEVAGSEGSLLANSNLIVSTVGSWGAEGALNEWHLGRGCVPPILYGWTEAHGCAGHAVAIVGSGCCLACGLSRLGEPTLRVTAWPDGISQQHEPACGAVFQPYGPVELALVNATIAALAIDVLLGRVKASTHRIWCGSRVPLEEVGGQWTPEWQTIAGPRTDGGFIEQRAWHRSETCVSCHRADAA
jgi:sulfur-carrier protein adenylyltransferase/sulfurtransferase